MSIVKDPNGKRKSDDSDSSQQLTPLQQARRRALLQFFFSSEDCPRPLDNVFYCEFETNGMTREMVNAGINDLYAQGRIELISERGVVHAGCADRLQRMSDALDYEGCGH